MDAGVSQEISRFGCVVAMLAVSCESLVGGWWMGRWVVVVVVGVVVEDVYYSNKFCMGEELWPVVVE